jgi:hypothetical protein
LCYVSNPAPCLPDFIGLPPVHKPHSNSLQKGQDLVEANTLLAKIAELKETGLEGEQVPWNFLKCREIQASI